MKIKIGNQEYDFDLKNKALYNFSKETGENHLSILKEVKKGFRQDHLCDLVYYGCKAENENFKLTIDDVIDNCQMEWATVVLEALTKSVIGDERYNEIINNPDQEKKQTENLK